MFKGKNIIYFLPSSELTFAFYSAYKIFFSFSLGVLNLPQSLRRGSNDPHVRWTLIGLEDQLWGRATSIGGQIGPIFVFQVKISTIEKETSLYKH